MLVEINCTECEEYKDELYELGDWNNYFEQKYYYFYCKECLEKKKIEFTFKDCKQCGNQILSSSYDKYCLNCEEGIIHCDLKKIEDPPK